MRILYGVTMGLLWYIVFWGPWQEMYKNDPRIWNAIMEMVCQHFADLERNGVDLEMNNGLVFPIVIGNKGDWSYLVPWLDYRHI